MCLFKFSFSFHKVLFSFKSLNVPLGSWSKTGQGSVTKQYDEETREFKSNFSERSRRKLDVNKTRLFLSL